MKTIIYFIILFLAIDEIYSQIDYSKTVIYNNAIPDYPIPYVLPTTSDIKNTIDRIKNYIVNTAVFNVIDNNTGEKILPNSPINKNATVDKRLGDYNSWDYPNGVVMLGMNKITEITGDTSFFAHNIKFFNFIFDYYPYFRELEKKEKITRHAYAKMFHITALDHCGAIGAGLIDTYQKHSDSRYRAFIDTIANYISNVQFRLADGTIARQRPQPESLWTDDFYMCIPFLAKMGVLTGDKKYWDDAVKQVIQLSKRLFNEQKGLFDHGWNTYSGDYDPRFYWGRANGWAAMAMAELLDVLPVNYPGRDKVLHIYRTHIRSLAELQDGTGLWHNLLDKNDTYLETSASAMFVYAIAKGINEGWISHIYGPVAQIGWNAVASKVLPNGQIDGVCEGTTYASDNMYYYYRGASKDATLGTGAVLLAGAEMIRLLQNKQIEIIEAKPNSVNSTFHYRKKNDPPMK